LILIFVEQKAKAMSEQGQLGIPYGKRFFFQVKLNTTEIEHIAGTVKREVNIQKNDIAEIISGAFKREKKKCKITKKK